MTKDDKGKNSLPLRERVASPFLLSPGGMSLIVAVAVFAVYGTALFNDFVYDDYFQVLGNRWITDVRFIPEIFTTNMWNFWAGASNYYRPLIHIIYMGCYFLFGLQPWGFHLVNVAFHAGVAVLVLLILRHVLHEERSAPYPFLLSPSFVAAMLFALHPVHTEAVTWVAGITDVSFAFFYLLAFYTYIRTGRDLGWRYALSLASYLLATLCKEPALTLPVIIAVYDYACADGGRRPREYVKRYAPYLAVAGVYFVLRLNALESLAPLRRHGELTTLQYVINVFPLFGEYLLKLILPVHLNAFHVLHPISSLLEPKGAVALLATVTFAAVAWLAVRKERRALIGLAFLLVPLAPALYIPGVGENSFAERYLYLPSFGFLFLLALGVEWLEKQNHGRVRVLAVLFVAVLGLYTVGTVRRNAVWKNNYAFWSDTVRKSPDSAVTHDGLGSALLAMGRTDDAIAEFLAALRIRPAFTEVHNNLGIAYSTKGDPDRAIEHLQVAARLSPYDANVHYNLGLAYRQKGFAAAARKEFETAVRYNPDDPLFRSALQEKPDSDRPPR